MCNSVVLHDENVAVVLANFEYYLFLFRILCKQLLLLVGWILVTFLLLTFQVLPDGTTYWTLSWQLCLELLVLHMAPTICRESDTQFLDYGNFTTSPITNQSFLQIFSHFFPDPYNILHRWSLWNKLIILYCIESLE